jgi:multidrug efflux system membrane fusion protein
LTTSTPNSPSSHIPPSPAEGSEVPVRSNRRLGWWLLVAALVVAAIAGYYLWYKPSVASGQTAGGQPAVQEAGQRGEGRKGGGGPGGRQGQGGQGNRPLPVIAEQATSGDMEVFLNSLGSVTALNSVTIRPRVEGQLMRIAFREGQLVRAGDVLAEIDPRPFQVQLTQAEGQMARDQALLRNARLDVERYAQLFAQDSIARQQLDTQRALVAQYEGAVKADQGAIDNAKLQLTYARITAPISGRLGLRQVDAGNIVRPGDTNGLVVITQVQPISVVFTLPEDSLTQVTRRTRAGAKLPVEAFDREQRVKLANGMLQSIDNQIDPTTGTVKLKAQFANQDESLYPNQFVNVRLLIDTMKEAVLIPTAAIQRGAQGTYVYVVKEDSSVTVRPVVLGPTKGEITSIGKGLQAGERVVVDGADKLREGGKVELITREAQNAAPGPGGGRRGQRDGQRKGGDVAGQAPGQAADGPAAGQSAGPGMAVPGPASGAAQGPAQDPGQGARQREGRRGASAGGPPQP